MTAPARNRFISLSIDSMDTDNSNYGVVTNYENPVSQKIEKRETKSTSEGKPIKKPEPKEREEKKEKPEHQYAPPGSSRWIAYRLRETSVENAKGLLRIWTHPKRIQEADEETIQTLNRLTVEDAEEAIQEMKGPKRYIRGSKGQQTMLKFSLEDVRTG